MFKYLLLLISVLVLSQHATAKCQWVDWEAGLHDKVNLIGYASEKFEEDYFDWPISGVSFYHTHPTRVEVKITGSHSDGRNIENNYAYQELNCGEVDENKSYGQPMCPLSGASPLANGTNPINTATGNKYQREVDFISSGEMPLMFVRHYNSQLTSTDDHIGQNWRHHYDRSVELINQTTPNGITIETEVRLSRPDGKIYSYYPSPSNWFSEPDVLYQVEKLSNGWKVTSPDNQTEKYDTSGRLLSIESLSGHTQSLLYDQNNRLYQVNDAFNQSLTIAYDANNRIHTVTAPDGALYTYSYDSNQNLVEVIFPGATTLAFKQYHYTDQRFPNALTAITDENGDQYAAWTYDENKKAISSEHAGATERVTVTYNSDGSATLIDSLGAVRNYVYSNHYGVPRTSSVTGGLCNACNGDTSSFTYDTNGFLTSTTDWEGNQITFTYNTRGLEEERVEAVGTPQERKTTTEWHATYRVPTKVEVFDNTNTLLQRTTYSYDSQGRRLSKTTESL